MTGGASGIGAATCRRLAAEGARVAVTDVNLDGARGVAGEIDGGAYELDVRSLDSIARTVAAVEEELGPVDVLVNNAGYDEWGFFTNTDEALWRRVLEVNLLGVIAVTHAVLPGHAGAPPRPDRERVLGGRPRGLERIGRVLGGQGRRARLHQGDRDRERPLRHHRPTRWRPGPIETPLLMAAPDAMGDLGKKLVENMIGSTVLRRLGQPDEVAAVITFLASDDASYVTGQSLGASGGLARL